MRNSLLLGLLFISTAHADDSKLIQSVWLNTGFWSHHFQQDKGFRENNYGAGLQLDLNRTTSATLGGFRNSDDQHSNYLGAIWQPIQWQYAKLGLWAGALDGYPNMRDGGWFIAAFPMASLEYQRVGLNLTIMPTYKDKLHGAFIAQLKFKLW